MTKNYLCLILNFCMTVVYGQNIKKEILIIGTMHEVPKIVKNSYKPLLKKALRYRPEMIFVERPMPDDTLSWAYLKDGWSEKYKEFYRISSTLNPKNETELPSIQHLFQKEIQQLTPLELDTMIRSFIYLRDYANFELYQYVKKYSSTGAKKPQRNENEDLTFKLALQLGIKKIYGVDDQQTNKEYHTAWQACSKIGVSNGDNKINSKLYRKEYNASILPALMGNLGKYSNSKKSIERVHLLNSFRYVKNQNEPCCLAVRYWDERNERIAKNIVAYITKQAYSKYVVIIGAGHVVGLKNALYKQNYNIEIKVLDDL